MWDIPRERRIATLRATIDFSSRHQHLVSRDNRFLYEASFAGETGRLWDLGSGQLLQVTNMAIDFYNSWVMAFSPDSRLLARHKTNGVELYDIRGGRTLQTLPSRDRQHVGALACSWDGRLLAAGSGNDVIVWDIASAQPVAPTLTGHRGYAVKIAFSPAGKPLLTLGMDNVLREGFWVPHLSLPFDP